MKKLNKELDPSSILFFKEKLYYKKRDDAGIYEDRIFTEEGRLYERGRDAWFESIRYVGMRMITRRLSLAEAEILDENIKTYPHLSKKHFENRFRAIYGREPICDLFTR